ncbi:hypothetical protein GGR50DRAFT_706039 [Xylaria sp. CBS 124048]|nr:hypothetical protein GGR50DRAFT_706039 [Xylaria sp. CBS 124048]
MDLRPSPRELSSQDAHRDETRGPDIVAVCAAAAVISSVIIALRLVSRHMLHGRFQLDASDWLALVAWVLLAITNITWSVGTQYGIGQHSEVVSHLRRAQVLSITGEVFYILAVSSVKFSVLALYANSFPDRKFRYWIWGVTISVAAWALSSAMAAVFQCTPADHLWRPDDARGHCVNLAVKNILCSLINVVVNVVISVMAIPLIWNLPLLREKKWLFACTFAAGTCVCIISVVRLPYSLRVGSRDGTWNIAPTIIVSIVEITLGILAVSIPTYRSLRSPPIRTHGSAPRSKDSVAAGAGASSEETLNASLYGRETGNDVNVTSPGTHHRIEVVHGAINVTNHIELIRHTNRCGYWIRVVEPDDELELQTSSEEPHQHQQHQQQQPDF